MMKLHIMKFFPASYHSITLSSIYTYSLQQHVLEHFYVLYSSPKMTKYHNYTNLQAKSSLYIY
jgi:hypothetical protein